MALPRVSRTQPPATNDNAINTAIGEAEKVSGLQDVLDDLLSTVSNLATKAYADAAAQTETAARQAADDALEGQIQAVQSALQDQIEVVELARQNLATQVQTVQALVAKTRTAALYADDRPGDGVSYFTTVPDNLAPIDAYDMDPARVVVTSEGRAIRLTGEQWVVSKQRFQVEPGRTGQARFAFFRSMNAVDPTNDTIRVGVLCYDATGAFLAEYPFADFPDVTTASGRIARSFRFTRDTDVREGVANIDPGTRSVRLYVYAFGGTQRTEIEVMAWSDVSDLLGAGQGQHIGGALGFGPELIGVATVRRALDGGAQPAFGDRGFRIPAGQTGAGTLLIPGLPAQGLSAGTKVRLRFDFQTSADLAPGTTLSVLGATVDKADGSAVGGNGPTLTQLVPGVYRGEFTYTLSGGETRFEYFVSVAGSGRSTPVFVALRNTTLEVLSTAATSTINAEMARYMEQVRARLAEVPDRRSAVTVAADGSSLDGLTRIRDGVAAVRAAIGPDERNVVFVAPGAYTDEASTSATIDQPDYVDVVGLGSRDDVRIIARFPDSQPGQDAIQPFFLKRTGRITNLTVIGRNVRYPIHIEAGNAPNRAVQVIEDVVAIHEGATGWASPTAIGVGQHEGNQQIYRRVHARSAYAALGIHNNVAWGRPSRTLIEHCELHGTGPDGRALTLTSNGAGIVSSVEMRGTLLNGLVRLDSFLLPGTPLDAHKANRYEYALACYGCSPFVFQGVSDVSALTLSSVAGASSAVAISGPGAALLFGAQPDVREGAADYAARVYSYHAVDVPAGEVDPGVTLAARLGNRTSAPVSFSVAWDGLAAVTIFLDQNYTGMTNAAIVSALNTKLASAMGGNTGGRAFSLTKPYQDRPPVYQLDREGRAINADSATILKGMALAWNGRSVRRMAFADTTSAFAGFALEDAIPGRTVRFLRTGWIGQAHVAFDGAVSPATGGRYQISASSPGRLVAGADRPLIAVRAIEPHGTIFEIIESALFSGFSDSQQIADFLAGLTVSQIGGMQDAINNAVAAANAGVSSQLTNLQTQINQLKTATATGDF